jgi:hypothetical protein
MTNLLTESWKSFDSYELRLLFDKHFGGPGQYDGREDNPNTIYLPLAREACQIALTYGDDKLVAIEPGPAFDAAKWQQSSEEIKKSMLGGPLKVGREYSFSSGHRVTGSWRGARSGVQILPPPEHAPQAPMEMADHPFILEYPIRASDFPKLTNYRRIREHRKLTLLLNLLLAGGARLQPLRSKHFWASVSRGCRWETTWVQEFFFSDLGPPVLDELSAPASERLAALEPEEYYANAGIDGTGLRVPADLDESICLYLDLQESKRDQFDRAAFWMDAAACQWTNSASSSFASLVTACESLTNRGTKHHVYCAKCNADSEHEVPGARERFRAFFENYAPGASFRKRRTQMYSLRSGILYGSKLMQLDQNLRFGWDPPGWDQTELHRELWSVTRMAARNWLKNPN